VDRCACAAVDTDHGWTEKQLREARRRMGMIFQEYALVERLTVMENVLSGQLGYVGFWRSLMRRFPPGASFRMPSPRWIVWDSSTTWTSVLTPCPVGSDSGWASRAPCCRTPDILLVDEPTASLDPKTSRQIMRLIVEACAERGLAAIINIHDVMLAQSYVQRIVGLRQGEVVYDGAPDGLSAEVLTTIYGAEDWSAAVRPTTVSGTGSAEMEESPAIAR
jgi:phosphonate transport system ATP-binding protein